MKSFDYVITDEVGIHARPAGLLAKTVKALGANVTVAKGDKTASATSLMKLMGMGIKKGDTITVSVEGDDEENAAAEIEKFFKENL
ncbi:MAG: HPr family phosphocarrier protein [Lachnospiraceae bacterium]|nr:HPr family phosphocarrier protein [Lachnospiraceae bacterium]